MKEIQYRGLQSAGRADMQVRVTTAVPVFKGEDLCSAATFSTAAMPPNVL